MEEGFYLKMYTQVFEKEMRVDRIEVLGEN
jgi:hypothetical protein